MSECLIAEAHLCEEIAGVCANENQVEQYRLFARECRDAAAATAGSARAV
jgi:hypothetical protein